jgi:hypothetical protein
VPRAVASQFHGLPAGSDRGTVSHADKLKVKTQRWGDQVARRAKSGTPGVGKYSLDKAYELKASLPRSVKKVRH